MPILWRYLLSGYLKIFSLSVCTFIAVLLVARFKDIARFTALSGDLAKTALFTLYQIPMILPVAIPISCLIASLLLLQKMSRTFELTALRASACSLGSICTPLLLASCLLALANFTTNAELSPFCKRESKTLFFRETSTNPLLLLQRQHLVKIKHAYLNMKIKEEGKAAKDLILIAQNESNQRLSLVSARQLRIAGSKLLGYDVAIVSHLNSEKEETFDSLVIENQSSMSTEAPVLSAALKRNRPHLETNALSLRMLRIKMKEGGKQAATAFVEIARRCTLALAAFSFTLLGCAFGIEEGRSPSKKSLLAAMALAVSLLMSYFLGKELKTDPLLASFAFFLPHPLIWCASLLKLSRIAKGAR